MRGLAAAVALLSLLLQVLASHALGGYPGTFYQIMLRFNKERKYARTAPSPSRLWAILDPAASLGSLSREPLNSNRIVRSAAFRSPESRQLGVRRDPITESSPEDPVTEVMEAAQTEAHLKEAVTQIPFEETVTQIPPEEAVTQISPEEAVTQIPPEEAVTQIPPEEAVTQIPPEEESLTVAPAGGAEVGVSGEHLLTLIDDPQTCGGDMWMGEVPTNLTVQEGGKKEEVLVTPGWDDGEYPQGIECVWNINVGTECQAGLLLYKVLEGQVRESSRCHQDYLEIVQPNGFSTKYCGPLVNRGRAVSGTDTWSSTQARTTTLRFKSVARRPDLGTSSHPRGFRMEVTYYCWVYNQAIHHTSGGDPATSGTTGGDAGGSGISGGDAGASGTSGGDAGGSGDSGETRTSNTPGGVTGTTEGEDDTSSTTGGVTGTTEGEDDTSSITGGVTGTTEGEDDTSSTTGGDPGATEKDTNNILGIRRKRRYH